MFSIILGIVVICIFIFWYYSAFYAKRLTEMKDEKAVEKIISNKNIAKSGLLPFTLFPTILILLGFVIYILF